MTNNAPLRKKTFKKPYETLLFQGHLFKVLDIHEAHQRIGDLSDFHENRLYDVYEDSWRFPLYEKNTFFLYTDTDARFDMLTLEYSDEAYPDIFILGFIFAKPLTVNTYIQAHDTDNSPTLIALSDVSALNIHLFGNIHYVGGNMTCEVLWGEYNHGELHVKGNLVASYVYADDMRMYFNNVDGLYLNGGDVIYTLLPVNKDESTTLCPTALPSSCSPQAILKDGFERGHLLKASMLDLSNLPTYTITMVDQAFDAVFAVVTADTEVEGEQEVVYRALPYETDGQAKQYISKTQFNGLNYRIGVLRRLDPQSCYFYVEYYTDNTISEMEYHWVMPFDENTLLNRVAKHNFFEAVEHLLQQDT